MPPAQWNGDWTADPASIAAMAALAPGTVIEVVKLAPDGVEATRYPATVVASKAPLPWIEAEAAWTLHRVEVAGLVFETGDTLREFFSAEHPFNAFAVYSPTGALRGWYGNVTYPAFILPGPGPLTIAWHDLYLDVVMLADGATHLLDDDELKASGMATSHPGLAAAVVQARRDLLAAIPALVPELPSS